MPWIQDDPKNPENNGLKPKLNGVVGGSIHGHETFILLDKETTLNVIFSCRMVFYVTMVTFQMIFLMNNFTNSIMEDGVLVKLYCGLQLVLRKTFSIDDTKYHI